MKYPTAAILLGLLAAPPALAQTTTDPFPDPIPSQQGVIAVKYRELATIPDNNGRPPRLMLLVDEPGTRRLFVNDMYGPLFAMRDDGSGVTTYLDLSDDRWNIGVQPGGNERGFQSFAVHPQFAQAGAPGYGRFYTLVDTSRLDPPPTFETTASSNSHDTVLLEWTARTASAAAYDGGPPRELIRWAQPFPNHNGGHLTFNPLAKPGDEDFGLLYIGFADGGSGGDPMGNAQNTASAFGKILRIDPLGRNSPNGQYGIPASNPYANDGDDRTLGEIYAIGLRNPQRFAWDSKTGRMYVADIGQNVDESVSPVTKGANLGWNVWEGSFRYMGREGVSVDGPRTDASITYPIVEYGQPDPLFQPQSAVTMCCVYRGSRLPALANLILFGDNPSGEILYVNADDPPDGGQAAIRRVLFIDPGDGGTAKNLLELVQQKNRAQGRRPASRADLRFAPSHDGERIFVLNKQDGVLREIVP
jgi:hypothetical protein